MNLYGLEKFLDSSILNLLSKLDNLKSLQEIRIRLQKPIIFQVDNKEIITNKILTKKDLDFTMQKFSNYSIYAFDEEIRQGYITVKGGHRIGICGRCVVENNKVKTIKDVSSINIRISKEVLGCSDKIIKNIVLNNDLLNTIIISPPKCGKTTLIRDISRNISNGFENFKGKKVSIIDERSEIAGCYMGIPQMNIGIRTDVLDNCPKSQGILMAIRSMGPEVIVCDEIGTYEDIKNIILALNSGVNLITTIHGYNEEDLKRRPVFDEIIKNNVFKRAIVLSNKLGVGTVDYIYDFDKKTKLRINHD